MDWRKAGTEGFTISHDSIGPSPPNRRRRRSTRRSLNSQKMLESSLGIATGALLKAYVINLDRSKDRLAHMREALGRARVEFERIAAVDGAALTRDALEISAGAARREARGLAAGRNRLLPEPLEAWRRIAAHDGPVGGSL